jgi:hypothetical protein
LASSISDSGWTESFLSAAATFWSVPALDALETIFFLGWPLLVFCARQAATLSHRRPASGQGTDLGAGLQLLELLQVLPGAL